HALASAVVGEAAHAGFGPRPSSIDELAPLAASALRLDVRIVARAIVVGVASAIAGALVPALHASSVAPIDALAPKGVALGRPSPFATAAKTTAGAVLVAPACGSALAADATPRWLRDATLTIALV